MLTWDPYAEFRTTTLANGLTIHAAHWPGRAWQEVGLLLHTGAYQDPIGLEGIAHFIEHLLSRNGSMEYQQMKEFFARNGGSVNFGGTAYPYTRYQFCVPHTPDKLKRGLEIFGELMLGNRLSRAIEEQRCVITEEFHRKYPTKFEIDMARRIGTSVLPGTQMERFISPLGDLDSIKRIAAEDLQRHYDTHYQPANISVIGVGGVPPDEFFELIASSKFGRIAGGTRTPRLPRLATVPPLGETRCDITLSKLTPPIPRSKARYESVARLPHTTSHPLGTVVRSMWQNVLFEEIRERRGWTYDISACFGHNQEVDTLCVSCESLNVEAIDTVSSVVEECRVRAASDLALFERFRDTLIAQQTMIDITGAKLCEGVVDDLVYEDRIVPHAEEIERLKRLTFKEARELLLSLDADNRWTALIRP